MANKSGKGLPLPGIRWRGFTFQLFMLTILPLTILVVGVALFSQSLHHQGMVSLVGDRNLRAVRTAGDGLSLQLDEKVNSLRTAAQMIDAGTNLAGQKPALYRLSAEFDGGMALFDSQGNLIETFTGQENLAAVPARQPEFWRQVNASLDDQVVLAVDAGLPNGALELAGVRLSDDRFLVGGFSPAPMIRQTTASILTNDQAQMLVFAANKEVLFYSGDPAALGELGSHPGVTEALNGESGVNTVSGDHGDQVTAFTYIPAAGWGLVLTENWEEIATPFLNTTQYTPLLMIPLLLLALVALYFGARQVIQPLQKLEEKTIQLAHGDFKALQEPVGGIDEIKHLQTVLSDTADDLRSAREGLRSYIGAITDGVEKERRGLARELHDDTLQALIALNQRFQLALAAADTDEERTSLEELQQMTEKTIANLRRMVRGLRPIYLEDLGMVAALEMLVKELGSAENRTVNFTVKGEPRRLTPEVELTLYRMAQEALSNADRHSQAKTIDLGVDFQSEKVILTVTDDGQGFDVPDMPDEFARQGHFGLLGLAERAELINAALEVKSHRGQGTWVRVTAPIKVTGVSP